MKNPIAARQRCMGYAEAQASSSPCVDCKHVKTDGADLRCVKGGFYVRPHSSCREFEARVKVAIGPTNV